MKKILIGSKAIRHWFPDFKRDPKDTDYAVDTETRSGIKGVEYLYNPVLTKDICIQTGIECGFPCYHECPHYLENRVATVDQLTTLKASHLCWDLDWDKHMFDLQFLIKRGGKIDDELFLDLYNFWNTYHVKNKRSDLKMSKADFFDNAVNYDDGEHDRIHTILNPVPIYTRVLKDGCEVELDEGKYHALSHEEKLDFVREEVMVMAYERYRGMDYRAGYAMMLKKFIISHAPFFSLKFTLLNYIELHKPKINYINKIKDGLQQNQLIAQ